jgi:hypothetical protein
MNDPTRSRREKIEGMLAADPDSEMLLYMLAMEQRKEADHAACLETFERLQHRQPPHVPSFFMGAQVLAELGRVEQARTVLRTGIEAARDQADSHAAGEMSEFLASLGSE